MCGGSRAYLILARESRLPGRRGQKLPQNSPARRPRWTSKASMASRKLVRACHQPRLPPPPYCAAAAARPSDATAGPDRDQRDLLCPPTRVGGAALRGRTIIRHRWTPDRRRVALLLFWLLPRPCNPSLRPAFLGRRPPRTSENAPNWHVAGGYAERGGASRPETSQGRASGSAGAGTAAR